MPGSLAERGSIRCTWMASLLAMLGLSMAAAPKPGVFEVDLLFPRNVTFAAGPLPPYVFAVQNPRLAYPLGALLSWTIWPYGSGHEGPNGAVNLFSLNDSVSNPYLVTGYMDQVSLKDGIWGFAWQLLYNNCSSNASMANWEAPYNHTVFTTDSKAQPVDLVAETAPQTCSSREYYAYNVTGFVQDVEEAQDPAACAEINPSPPSKPNPCAVQLSSDTASSIYASNSANALAYCHVLAVIGNTTSYCSAIKPTATAKSAAVRFANPAFPLFMALASIVGAVAGGLY